MNRPFIKVNETFVCKNGNIYCAKWSNGVCKSINGEACAFSLESPKKDRIWCGHESIPACNSPEGMMVFVKVK